MDISDFVQSPRSVYSFFIRIMTIIRQHGSAVFVEMAVVVCMLTSQQRCTYM